MPHPFAFFLAKGWKATDFNYCLRTTGKLHFAPVEDIVFFAARAVAAFQAADEQHRNAHCHQYGQHAPVYQQPMPKTLHVAKTNFPPNSNSADAELSVAYSYYRTPDTLREFTAELSSRIHLLVRE